MRRKFSDLGRWFGRLEKTLTFAQPTGILVTRESMMYGRDALWESQVV